MAEDDLHLGHVAHQRTFLPIHDHLPHKRRVRRRFRENRGGDLIRAAASAMCAVTILRLSPG